MYKKSRVLMTALVGSLLIGCNGSQVPEKATQTTVDTTQQENVAGEESEVKTDTAQEEKAQPQEKINEVDYSTYFEGINGCAEFFNPKDQQIDVYNKDLAKVEASPCSTFKIVSTLIGLEAGVLKGVDTKMGYDSKITYPMDIWNEDLDLKGAFERSCVWYYHKVINAAGKEKVDEVLRAIDYGNCDTSEWEGNGINELEDLNGFWLESSLKISPDEQVHVLSRIFAEDSPFSKEELDILKEIMLIEKNPESEPVAESEDYKVYGKTGTGYGDNAWFVGMVEGKGKTEYFAVRLNEKQEGNVKEKSMKTTGGKAKEIALKIIEQRF